MSTTKDASYFIKFSAQGQNIPIYPRDDISFPDLIQHGWFVNGKTFGNGENAEEGKVEFSFNISTGCSAYHKFQALEQQSNHGCGTDLYILQKFNNGKLDSNEYSDKIPTGIQHQFKIVVVQPIKPTQMFYKKEDDGYDTSTATITLGLVRTGISTHVYD